MHNLGQAVLSAFLECGQACVFMGGWLSGACSSLWHHVCEKCSCTLAYIKRD